MANPFGRTMVWSVFGTLASAINYQHNLIGEIESRFVLSWPSEAYISGIAGEVDSNGVSGEKLKGFLKQLAAAFADWINRLAV